LPSLIKGRPSTTTTNNNNKAKCIPGGTLRVLAGKKFRPKKEDPSLCAGALYLEANFNKIG
jgi:hypothetical protein